MTVSAPSFTEQLEALAHRVMYLEDKVDRQSLQLKQLVRRLDELGLTDVSDLI